MYQLHHFNVVSTNGSSRAKKLNVTFTFVPVDQEILAHLFLFLKQIITGKDKKNFSACNAVTSRKLTKKLNKEMDKFVTF